MRDTDSMRFKKHSLLAIMVFIWVAQVQCIADQSDTSDYAAMAKKYDGMYTLGPEASQQKALEYYQKALDSNPDSQQKLQILYRMAQLNSSCFDKQKGEKPNQQEAVKYYKRIIDEYPQDEPLVIKAYSGVCDNYTISKNFEEALVWAKKSLQFDVSAIEAQLKGLQEDTEKFRSSRMDVESFSRSRNNTRKTGIPGNSQSLTNPDFAKKPDPQEMANYKEKAARLKQLKESIYQIKKLQKTAVDQISYTAERMGIMRAYGELQKLAKEYQGTFIGDYAAVKLNENMDRMPDLWKPKLDDGGFGGSGNNASLVSNDNAAATVTSVKDIICQDTNTIQPLISAEKINIEESNKPKENKYSVKEERAPPEKPHLYQILIYGIIVLIILSIFILNKFFQKGK